MVNLYENIQKINLFWSCYFNFNFFAVFSKMQKSISTLPVSLSIMKFFVAQTSRTRFFSIVVKLNIFVITKATILIFLVNLNKVNIYKFPKKENLIQPPGEPREQHLGDVRQKKFELHKIS